MGDFIAFVGFIGLVIALIALIKGRLLFLRIRRRRQAAVLALISSIWFVMGAVMAAPPTDIEASAKTRPSASPSIDLKPRLVSYVRANAASAAGGVKDYVLDPSGQSAVIETSYAVARETLPKAQLLCETARNVVQLVRVQANDGTDIWSCDRVSSTINSNVQAVLTQQEGSRSSGPGSGQEGSRGRGG
jgi:hypothetical protein